MDTLEQEITEQTLAIIKDYDESCVSVTVDSKLIEDFNLDSLDMLVLATSLETFFEIDIPTSSLSVKSTVQDLINTIVLTVKNNGIPNKS